MEFRTLAGEMLKVTSKLPLTEDECESLHPGEEAEITFTVTIRGRNVLDGEMGHIVGAGKPKLKIPE
jgi:hypothetical protein